MGIGFLLGQKHRNARRTGLGCSDNGAERRIDLAVFPSRYGGLGRPKPASQCGLTDTCPPACSADDNSSMHWNGGSISANPVAARSREERSTKGRSQADRMETGWTEMQPRRLESIRWTELFDHIFEVLHCSIWSESE
jgi:hypothetical protein